MDFFSRAAQPAPPYAGFTKPTNLPTGLALRAVAEAMAQATVASTRPRAA